jgi:hypothetical protein
MVPAVSNWEHKDTWVDRHHEDNFTVEVSRHGSYVDEHRGMGKHRWCVYVYVYPKHPFFKRIEEDLAAPPDETGWKSSYPNMVGYLPLHCGCSFFHIHRNEKNEITSYQIGADYNHLHDEWFTHLATKEDANTVFHDAEALVEYMLGKELK